MTEYLREVYHGSPLRNLSRITPHNKYGEGYWIYACQNLTMAAAFVGRLGGDFTCTIGSAQGKPFLCERFEGAFELRFGGVKGSIYVLRRDYFTSHRDAWQQELVCNKALSPLREIQIDNAKEYLLGLADRQKLLINLYPERPEVIPADDDDLVEPSRFPTWRLSVSYCIWYSSGK